MPAATACLIEVVAFAAVSPRLPGARDGHCRRALSFLSVRSNARRVSLFRREQLKDEQPASVRLCCGAHAHAIDVVVERRSNDYCPRLLVDGHSPNCRTRPIADVLRYHQPAPRMTAARRSAARQSCGLAAHSKCDESSTWSAERSARLSRAVLPASVLAPAFPVKRYPSALYEALPPTGQLRRACEGFANESRLA